MVRLRARRELEPGAAGAQVDVLGRWRGRPDPSLEPRFDERRGVPSIVWSLFVGIGGAGVYAVLQDGPTTARDVLIGIGFVGALWALLGVGMAVPRWSSSWMHVRVDDDGVWVRDVFLVPAAHLGEARVLRGGEAWRAMALPRREPRVALCTTTFATLKEADELVEVEVVGLVEPRRWAVATSHPEEFIAAVEAVARRARRSGARS